MSLKNPEVVPIVIVLLILYFCLRLYIEWRQCGQEIQSQVICKFDFILSYLLAITSMLVYAVQQVSDLRVAEFVTVATIFGILAGIGMYKPAYYFVRMKGFSDQTSRWLTPVATCFFAGVLGLGMNLDSALSMIFPRIFTRHFGDPVALRLVGVGLLIGAIIKVVYEEWKIFKASNQKPVSIEV